MWCLAELALPSERVDFGGAFGGNREETYLRLNPNGVVPTLIDGNHVVWESNTILRYLGNTRGESLYPPQPARRSEVDCWMDWQLGTLNNGITPLFQSIVRTPVDQRQPEVVEQHRAATARWMSLLDAALAQREFVAGPTLSLADLALGPSVYRWFELHVERPKQPHLQAWYERMAKRPGFLTHVMVGLS
ncbi:probable glutathione S-transferase [Bordetella petrii]|uniref:Probable glutathione S-transferase n=2 Tax=Betaproteobacteria TaxID=28216 RepID=A9IG56_BORPD|nr:probable glutathione S-transferase [Bordetella petrii]